MELAARLLGAGGLDALLLGAVVAELLDLGAAPRPELLHDGLLLGRGGVEQLQDLLADLGGGGHLTQRRPSSPWGHGRGEPTFSSSSSMGGPQQLDPLRANQGCPPPFWV